MFCDRIWLLKHFVYLLKIPSNIANFSYIFYKFFNFFFFIFVNERIIRSFLINISTSLRLSLKQYRGTSEFRFARLFGYILSLILVGHQYKDQHMLCSLQWYFNICICHFFSKNILYYSPSKKKKKKKEVLKRSVIVWIVGKVNYWWPLFTGFYQSQISDK